MDRAADATSHTVLTGVGAQIPRWGPHAETDGLLALWQQHSAGAIDYTAEDHGLVVALTPIERRQTRLAGENGPMHLAPAGSLNVVPAGADHWGCWGNRKESVYLALAPARVEAVAISHFERDTVELVATNRQQTDPALLRLSLLLREELRRGGLLTELYLDALGTMIMVHLLRCYSTLGDRAAPPSVRRGGLSLQARRAVLDYMAAHCTRAITLAELAAIARLAPSTFLRAFRDELGVTPHRHLLTLRVARARELLLRSDLPLAQVALAAGFAHQSHLTMMFRRFTGTTPAGFRLGHDRQAEQTQP